MINFSCADFTFPTIPHEMAFNIIAMLGFKYVDVGIFKDRSHLRPETQLADPEHCGKQLFEKAKRYGLKVDDIFYQSSLNAGEFPNNHPDAAIRNMNRVNYTKLIDYTLASGAKHFTDLPGMNFDNDSFNLAAEELAWRVDYGKQNGVVYSVEPSFDTIMGTPEKALKMLKAVEGLTLALDYSHFVGNGFKTEEVHPLLKYASLLHARGAKNGYVQCAYEENTTDFASIIENLKSLGYNGNICMEYCYLAWAGLNRADTLSETIKLRQYLAGLLDIDVLTTDYSVG